MRTSTTLTALLYAALAGLWVFAIDLVPDLMSVETHLFPGIPLLRAGLTLIVLFLLLNGVLRARRQAEEQRHTSELRLAAIVDQAADAIISVDESSRIALFNQSAQRIFGYAASEVVGQPIDVILPPRLAAAHQQHMRRFVSGSEILVHMEERHEVFGRRKAGSEFPCEASVSKLAQNGQLHLTVILRDITERKQAEELVNQAQAKLEQRVQERTAELQLANSLLHALLETLPAGVLVADAAGLIILSNKAAYDMLGGTITGGAFGPRQGSLFRRPDHTPCPTEDLPLPRALARGEVTHGFEALIQRPDGREAALLMAAAPVCDTSQHIFAAIETFQDVTEIKRAEQALRESEERYRAFVADSSEGIWRFENKRPIPLDLPVHRQIEQFFQQTVLAECNDAFAQMYGYARADQVIGVPLGDIFDRANPLGVDIMHAFIDAGYRLTDVEWSEVDRTGRLRYFAANVLGIIENGALVRTWGIQQDITGRKQNEAELRKLSLVVDQIPVTITITDFAGNIEYINPSFTQLTGYSLAEVRGQNPRLLKSGQTPAKTYQQLWATILAGSQWQGELCNKKKNGEIYWASVSISPIKNQAGRTTHFVSLEEDITERKQEQQRIAWLASFPELNPLPVAEVDLAGHLYYLNPAAKLLVGSDMPAMDRHPWLADLEPAGRKLQIEETGVLVRDVTVDETVFQQTLIYNPDTRRVRIYSLDVTKRKLAEQQNKQIAVLEERQHLARELHDSLSQALFGISLGVHTALTWLDRDRVKVIEALEYALSLADAGLTEMRALIFQLRPESLALDGLVNALTKQAASIRARHELMVDTEFCPEPDITLNTKEAIYRIAQEALHNAVRHARASRLKVLLCTADDHLQLEVSDDGIGFDAAQSQAGHLGLSSMRERVQRLNGTLDIDSAPGRGTRIQARFPKSVN